MTLESSLERKDIMNTIKSKYYWMCFHLWRMFVSKPKYLRFKLRVWLWYKLTDETPSPSDWLRWQS